MVFVVWMELHEGVKHREVVGIDAVGSKNKGDSLSFTAFLTGPRVCPISTCS